MVIADTPGTIATKIVSASQWPVSLVASDPDWRSGGRRQISWQNFEVSLGKIWRRIAVAADCSLDELAVGIIHAFDFDGNHLDAFQIPQSDGTILAVEHPYVRDSNLHIT